MKSHFIKLASSAAFSFVLASSAFAGIDDRLDTLEKDMQEVSARNPQDTLGASFVTSRPEVKGNNWFLTLDITYWHTKMGGTEYAYSLQPNFSGNVLLPQINGDMKENDFGWDVGVKVGLGYKTPHDAWDIYARYTYFNSDDTSSSSKAEPSALVSLTNFALLFANKVKSHVEIDYDNVDLELARSYFYSQYLAFRPHFDLKTTWIDIDQDVQITASSINGGTRPVNTDGLDFKTKDDCRFWGLGPRVGIDSKWFLGYGFHIFGDLAGSVQYGYFKTEAREFVPPSALPFIPDGQVLKMKHKFHRFIPSVQMFLGLGYDTYLNDEKQHLGFKLGYEVQYYWRVNQITKGDEFTFNVGQNQIQTRLAFEKASEDLMFYGITGEVRLDF
ncbi:MAG: MOMP family protein [Chlamydiia bacterium]|nr:MOMP family protein [Chlamydiia bacterium]